MILLKSAAVALGLLTLSAGGAFAQSDAMMKNDGAMMAATPTKMSAADMKTTKRCKALSNDKRAKDSACAKLAKAHPDMMKKDAMMSDGGAMASDSMMKKH